MSERRQTPQSTTRSGPRGSGSDARGDILEAATALFAQQGYAGTTLRQIADRAGVDVALISYYFRNKEGLFGAALELPVDPSAVIEAVFAEGLDGIGERLIRTLFTLFEDETTRVKVLMLMRADSDHALEREFVDTVVLKAYSRHLPGDQPELRASLAASHLIGLAIARHVVGVPTLASLSIDQLVDLVAPTLDRYLVGDLESG